ncbi:hypothetical protein PZ61_0205230 [Streptomyces sp. MNU77]|uniref:hypothetical protein n=1 Tax=Streptomyces sp. MNU77 TaxID=1573406 RepID=UPI00094BA028|nr:hypothetical protein [Streptomyces sp. MNU77]OLO29964.1 hypothetical protein PZ61_0205230 [Streptomyces sp. MNU77]
MTVHQQAYEVGVFAQYLRDLVARLDPGRGWYGVFARRDPVGMRSCLDGVEIPPWDVVESLLADLAAQHGARFAEQVSVRAAALYSASAATHDRRPGGRQELVHRLELMVREQRGAAERLRGAGVDGPGPAEPEALAWARDDHERATARCAELRGRLAAVAVPEDWSRAEDSHGPPAGADGAAGTDGSGAAGADGAAGTDGSGAAGAGGAAGQAVAGAVGVPRPRAGGRGAAGGRPHPGSPGVAGGSGPAAPAPAPRRGKPRGARFAGLEIDEEETGYAPSPLPGPPAPARSGPPAPRGARFGGGAGEEGREGRDAAGRDRAPDALPDPAAGQAVAGAVAQLIRLRAEGRGGEAHVVLCEVAAWPAPRLPVLAVALYRAGLAADWTTLLWEVSSLPPAGFAAAAGALAAAGREADCGLLLRQGVARPAAEVAEAVLVLDGAGREREARDLLGAFVRVRTPREAAELAGTGGTRLLRLLLAAAREVSVEREWDLVHALRVAGVPGV